MQLKGQPHIRSKPFLLGRTHDSFTHRASIIWNALPVKIKSSPSLASFKTNIAKQPKSILDGTSFGTSSTVTYKNTNDFCYLLLDYHFVRIILFIYACRTLLYPCS